MNTISANSFAVQQPNQRHRRLLLCLSLAFSAGIIIGISSYKDARAENRRLGVTVSSQGADPQKSLVIRIPTAGKSEPKVFVIENPLRIVVDIPGASSRRNETLSSSVTGLVSRVRVGSHSDKLRVVADIAGGQVPAYSTKSGKGFIELVVSKKETDAAPPLASPTHKESTATKLPQDGDKRPIEPTSTQAPKPAHKETPPSIPTLSATPVPTTVPNHVETKKKSDAKESPKSKEEFVVKEAEEEKAHAIEIAKGSPEKADTTPALPIEKKAATLPSPAPTKIGTPVAAEKKTSTVKEPSNAVPEPFEPDEEQAAESKIPPLQSPAAGEDLAQPTGEKTVLEDPKGSPWTVRSVVFDKLPPTKTPLLKLILSRTRAQVQIAKVDAKTYRLTILNAKLGGPHLTLPQFPPADFEGFTVVSAKQADTNVEVTIGVEPGTTLGTFVKQSEIWTKKL